jgi:hypothetical protein
VADAMEQELQCAADEMVKRFGDQAAMEAAMWSNDALERGNMERYEYWQQVSMKITAQTWAKPAHS